LRAEPPSSAKHGENPHFYFNTRQEEIEREMEEELKRVEGEASSKKHKR